jgi:glycosyltransferase involved in cell wall biosynthesis
VPWVPGAFLCGFVCVLGLYRFYIVLCIVLVCIGWVCIVFVWFRVCWVCIGWVCIVFVWFRVCWVCIGWVCIVFVWFRFCIGLCGFVCWVWFVSYRFGLYFVWFRMCVGFVSFLCGFVCVLGLYRFVCCILCVCLGLFCLGVCVMGGVPVVCVFGADLVLFSGVGVRSETNVLDCRCYVDDLDLFGVLGRDRPQVIVSVGRLGDFVNLLAAPFFVRRRWLHFDEADPCVIGPKVFSCFLSGVLGGGSVVFPLLSVFTAAFRSGDRIRRAYESLRRQSYFEWEWVVLDDSGDGGRTYDEILGLVDGDYRVRVFRQEHCGRIGEVKRNVCGLCRGEVLVELDHDDVLVGDCLLRVADAVVRFPSCGFFYSDFSDVCEDGTALRFGGGSWGFGYGGYVSEVVDGRVYYVARAPNINAKTIRHITSAPNHVRCWRRSFYNEVGGHCPLLHVADDFELVVRSFLGTRFVRIPHLCYVQFFGRGRCSNTQGRWVGEIQRLVRYIAGAYNVRIHERLLELGVDDFIWRDGVLDWGVPNPVVESHCTLLA